MENITAYPIGKKATNKIKIDITKNLVRKLKKVEALMIFELKSCDS